MAALLLLSGCVSSIKYYENKTLTRDQGIVLLGLISEIPLVGASGCPICTSYEFGGRRDIYAFPVEIGFDFNISQISTYDNRSAGNIKAGDLHVSKAGIYYYGTVYGTTRKVLVDRTPNARMLLAARRKYGGRFDKLKPIGFEWPDSALDKQLPFGYQISPKAQSALSAFKGKRMQIGKLEGFPSFDAKCRAGGPLALPDFLPYEDYIKRALNLELASAGILDEGQNATTLTGSITGLSFSSWTDPHWTMSIQLAGPTGQTASGRAVSAFGIPGTDGALGCAATEDAVPLAVRRLIEDLVSSDGFRDLVSASSPIATSGK
ncbi:MAG TPA: hypothetical protein VFL86_27645 [Burkholderiaceae bacterium]|nr:hypothetical protein [Burkholderiaceae bacterium]